MMYPKQVVWKVFNCVMDFQLQQLSATTDLLDKNKSIPSKARYSKLMERK